MRVTGIPRAWFTAANQPPQGAQPMPDAQTTPAVDAVAAIPDPDAPTPPTMAERIAAEQEANPLCHDWIVAATVRIDNKTARRASFRGSFRTEGGMRIDALETYCSGCRRPLDQVADEPCSAKINNEHLIGGDQRERAKRIIHQPRGRVIKTGLVDRKGLAGYSVHAGR